MARQLACSNGQLVRDLVDTQVTAVGVLRGHGGLLATRQGPEGPIIMSQKNVYNSIVVPLGRDNINLKM